MHRPTKYSGFTIVELLIVVVVIAILAAIIIVSYNGIQNKARESAARHEASTALTKVKAYAVQHEDTYPATLADAGLVNSGAVTYQYWVNPDTSIKTFCATVTASGVSYHTAATGKIVQGPCTGHTGAAPAALDCPSGFITIPGNAIFGTDAFCAMKYEAKNVGGVAVSRADISPWVSMTQNAARTYAQAACTGCHLMTAEEQLTIAQNLMSVASNWSGGAVGSGTVYSGHNDSTPAQPEIASTDDTDGYIGTGNASGDQKRTLTLTNGEVIWDFVGNVWEWLDLTATGGQPGLADDTTEVYKGWNAPGVIKGDFGRFFPAYGSNLATTWGSLQGLGKMITNSNFTVERGVHVGGAYTTGYVNAGLFTLRINNYPTQTSPTTGFRVAR